MPKKKKPSFFSALFGVLVQSIGWLIGTAVPGAFQIYQFYGGTMNTISNIPSWVWFAPLAFYVTYVILRTIYVYRKEISDYESSKERPRTKSKKTNKAEAKSVAMQDVNGSPVTNSNNTNFNSNNKSNTSIGTVNFGSEDRTKKDLRLQIGVELQVFSKAFDDVYRAHPRDLRATYDKADLILEKLTSDLVYRANLLLTDTPIPGNLVELKKYYEQFSQDLFIHHSVEEKISGYIIKGMSLEKKRSRVPPELDMQARDLRISLDANYLTVQYIVGDILKLCKE